MNEIQPYAAQMVPASVMYMPIAEVAQAVQRRMMIKEFTENVMVKGRDYGEIPGTTKQGDAPKLVLLKPGAEKLGSWFGLYPIFVVEERILDFSGLPEHGNEPLIYYRVRCDLYRMGVLVGSGTATANSRETKWRYRNAERVCPECGKPTVRKSKPEKGGGYYCWDKLGGCGATFPKGAASIEGQELGKVLNPEVGELDNTIYKICCKRSLVAGTCLYSNVSDYFTQDLEDFAEYHVVVEQGNGNGAPSPDENFYPDEQPTKKNGNGKAAPQPISADTLKHLHALGRDLYGDLWDGKRPALVQWASMKRVTSSKDLTEQEAGLLIDKLNERLAELKRAAAAEEAAGVPTVHA